MFSIHGYVDPVPQLGRTDTGGQVVYVLQLAKALAKHGIGVDIYTRWFDRNKLQIEPVPDYANVKVIRIPGGPWRFIAKEELYDTLPVLADNAKAFIHQNSLRYDLFHGHYVDGGMVTLEVAETFNKPAFFTAHSLGAWKREQMDGDPQEMERKYKFSRRISEESRIFKSIRAQIFTTKIQEERARRLYGFVSGKTAVIPPGVDIYTFHRAKAGEITLETGLPGRYILCLSRLDTNKGHDLLLNAFNIVSRSIPDIHLVIAGGSPKPRLRELEVIARMRAIIRKNQLHDKVHIVGYVPDDLLAIYYRQAELFVLPSVFEPFGMTTLEAMACGKPVVASKLGGIREVISSGINGLLVDPSNEVEFSDGMVSLLQDRRLAQLMGEAALSTVLKHFSWKAIAKRILRFYEKNMY
jgi:mannosylfructose-phosphate synthase